MNWMNMQVNDERIREIQRRADHERLIRETRATDSKARAQSTIWTRLGQIISGD